MMPGDDELQSFHENGYLMARDAVTLEQLAIMLKIPEFPLIWIPAFAGMTLEEGSNPQSPDNIL